MKAAHLLQNDSYPKPTARSFLKFIFYLPVLLLLQLWAMGQSANLDQGANDKYTTPLSPVDWINGNLNMNSAHFLEGHSVPYRAILKDLVPNQNYTLVIGLDVKNSGKHALDYITHFQRLNPHVQFGHGAETVNPLLNITGFPPAYFTSTDTEPIPAPSSAGSPVAGQPTASFNALPAGERLFTGYNADLLSVTYSSEGNLNGTNEETVIHITFKALTETVVLAWGGHIASVVDWGTDPITNETRSASGINGSPYHMRLKNWIINGNVVSIGNQDRSLKTDAVIIPPTCEVTGPTNACAETPSLAYVATVDNTTGLTYAWSIIGANTANAKIVDATLGTIQVVPIGTAFTPGFFNLQLIVTRNGFKDTCYLNGHEIPGVSVIIAQVTVDAGTDQAITNLDVASLSASAVGGTGVYTFSWTPTTGLSDPNIANPQFTPPSTGTFQFIVTAFDGNNCVDIDTVVINVTEHPKPPCGITGPTPVCPGTKNEYAGPPSADVGSYLWSVTGDASISGDNDKEKVMIQADNKCGSYLIQLIVSTPDGKVKDTCYLTVNITDAVKPVLSGTVSDATVSCASDIPAPPVVTATDNCVPELNVEMSQTVVDSTCVNKFKVVRKWWATDLCGNTSDTLTQVITVFDDVKPVITADFDKEINVQCLKDIPAPPAPTATDNCNGNIPAVCTAEGSGTACDSTITRKWVFTDACGNSDSVTQVIHIKDNIAPVLTGDAGDVNATCAKDVPAAGNISATDNCDENPALDFSQTVIDSTCVNKFKVVRKWWAKDDCGNTSDTLTQVITVFDDVKPVITADFDKEINVQCLKDIPAPPNPTATDNCDGNVPAVCSAEGSGTACDSTITRKWVFTDACGNSDFVTQVIHIKDNIAPVLTGEAGDIKVACASGIPVAANIGATDNCDENPLVEYSQVVSDSTCVNKFKVVRKWWAKDACGNISDTLTQVITVFDDVKPVITADFDKEINVQCLKDIPAPPAPTATDNCNGNIPAVCSAEGSGTACDSTITRKWVFTDACGNSDFVTQVIRVKDDIAPVATFQPGNVNLPCNSPVQFGEPIFADNCEGDVTVTFEDRKEGTTCPFTHIRRWTAKDACGNTSWVEQAITVECCKESFCTYTQGFYGNTGGKGCTPSGVQATSKQMMIAAVDAQPGDSVFFGLKSTGKFFTLFLGDITNDNIFKMLPGGGTPVALKGYATFSKTNTWSLVPILTTKANYGKINNILLAQTMALFFNMELSPDLKGLQIEGDSLFTKQILTCGTTNTAALADTFLIPASVVNYLKSIGKANVLGLYELANMYLGGQTVSGVAISDVNKAVDAINRGFDKCAFLVGWANSSATLTLRSTNNVAMSNTSDAKMVESTVASNSFAVKVFPNPYSDKLIFHFVAPVKGAVNLEMFNVLGQRVGQRNFGVVEKGSTNTIEYKTSARQNITLLYRLSVGNHTATGKAIHE